jgi:hypothetical protein
LIIEAVHTSGWLPEITEVVHGGARGIDEAAGRWAAYMGLPVRVFPADWTSFGRSAGPRRNREMAQYADRLVAIWDGKSRGTGNMIETMRSLGKPVCVHCVGAPA